MIVESIQGLANSLPVSRGAGSGAGAPPEGASFGDTLGKIAEGAIETLKFGEATAIAGLSGGATPLAVVNAVTSAQHALQAALAIRDKAVSAYQEISRQAI